MLGAIAALYAVFGWIAPEQRLALSLTTSLPARLWLIDVGQQPQRGDYIAFRIPENRFYRSGHGGFLKIARGIPGDRVTHEGPDFLVDGQFVGTAKRESLGGLPLAPGPTGVLPPEHYFVWTPDADSFDSRYADIGWIPQSSIVGVARPLF